MAPTSNLAQILKGLEGQTSAFSYGAVTSTFKEAIDMVSFVGVDQDHLQAEHLAFSFRGQVDGTRGDAYFGPAIWGERADGSVEEVPSRAWVTEAILSYWAERADATANPALKARYADLVWDLSQMVGGRRREIRFAHTAIDASIEAVRGGLFEDAMTSICLLKRALDLSISIRDTARTRLVAQSIVDLEDLVSVDHLCGLWGFAFDALVNLKIFPLRDTVRDKLLADLEGRLDRFAQSGTPDPSTAEPAMARLVNFYSRSKRDEDVQRIIQKYAAVVESFAVNAHPFAASSWLEKLHELLSNRGLKADAARIAVQLMAVDQRTVPEGQRGSFQIAMQAKEVDAEIARLLEDGFETALGQVASQFLLPKDTIEKQVRDIAKQSMFWALLKISVRDTHGRAVASVGPVRDDVEGRVMYLLGQNLELIAPLLRRCFVQLGEKFDFNAKTVHSIVAASSVFNPKRLPFVLVGLDAIFAGQHLVAACVLIPELEAGLRQLLSLVGGSVYKAVRGGFHLLNMDEVLRNSDFIAGVSGELPLHFRALFTDARAWNLRNEICHGLPGTFRVGQATSDWILHAILVLASLRPGPKPPVDVTEALEGTTDGSQKEGRSE